MKCSKGTYTTIKAALSTSISRYISYVEDFCMEYNWLFEDIENYNLEIKQLGSTEAFEKKYDIDLKEAFKSRKYFMLLSTAQIILENLDNIHTQVIDIFISPDNFVYPVKTLEWLSYFQRFCVADNNTILSLEEQNGKLREYHHFDASKKRPKALGFYV